MRDFSLSHLGKDILLQNLSELVRRDRAITADLLAYIAEVDARRLYDEAGYSSMFAYCVRKLHLSENAAWKRIQAARAGRRFPALFGALDQGPVHLAGLCMLAPHVTEDNVSALIEGATHKTKAEIEAWLVASAVTLPATVPPCVIKPVALRSAERTEPPDEIDIFSASVPEQEPAPVENHAGGESQAHADVSSNQSFQPSPGKVEVSANLAYPQASKDLTTSQPASAPEHYRMQVVIPRDTHDKLRRAQALLGHAVPSGDVAEVLDRALDLLVTHLERRKFGARGGYRGRKFPRRESPSARYVPMRVRRAVWERDQGQCTFVSDGGERCGEQTRLEYDHIRPVARGGEPTVDNVRLRCRAHNQCEAKRVFGGAFMERKRRGDHSLEQ